MELLSLQMELLCQITTNYRSIGGILKIWAIADLHLSFGVSGKNMDIFGSSWINHAERVKERWQKIQPEDLVLIAGDISWAKRLEEAAVDLQWIGALPGIKVIIQGNHDYWWQSLQKMRSALPPSLHALHGNAFTHRGVTIAGCRMWDSQEYHFSDYIDYQPGPPKKRPAPEQDQKIFERDFLRLKRGLDSMDPKASLRIAMTHYPPIGADLQPSRISKLLEQHKVDLCVFGHLHSVRRKSLPFGRSGSTRYILSSCDYLECDPTLIAEVRGEEFTPPIEANE